MRISATSFSGSAWRRSWRIPLAAVLIAGVSTAVLVSQGSASAAESIPVGWGSQNGGTTGGAGGSTVTVTSA